MTHTPDEPPRRVSVHANAATQDGFTMIPNAVMTRADLTPGAKLVYGWLKHLAWRERSAEIEPPQAIIAGDLSLAERTVLSLLKELREAPTAEGNEAPDADRLVVAKRRGQGRTNTYFINDPETTESRKSSPANVAGQQPQDAPNPARARSSSRRKTTTEENNPPTPLPLEQPPPVVLAGTRNVPLDVVMEVCSVPGATDQERMARTVVALNGRLHKTTGRVLKPGMRHAFWEDCRRQAARDDAQATRPMQDAETRLRALQADPVRFAALLADRIRAKAAAYRQDMPGAMCTPKALLDWWATVGTLGGSGITADEIERMDLAE